MLTHNNSAPQAPDRTVIIGSRGFLGQNTAAHLNAQGVETLCLTSDDIDLGTATAAEALAEQLRPGDAVVMFAALTPDKGKGIDTMMANLKMAEAACDALGRQPVSQVVYISSDAVYPMAEDPVSEESCAAPGDLYGTMHKAREVMFQSAVQGPLAILRPTLVYGAGDSHNSYGPNRFRRVAAADGKITIGGEGEETRDHIFVGDVAKLIGLTLSHRSSGVLNLATGRSTSFYDVAHLVAEQFGGTVEVICTDRNAPITHRAFDITATRNAFPAFGFLALEEGIAMAHAQEIGT